MKAGDNAWNAGYCCDGAEKDKIDDVQFARDMIKWLEANTCVDPKRIYASGGSNGGGMSYRLACDAADVIAAVAPVDFRCVTGREPGERRAGHGHEQHGVRVHAPAADRGDRIR